MGKRMLNIVRRNQYGEVVPVTFIVAQVIEPEKKSSKKSMKSNPAPKGVKRGRNITVVEMIRLSVLSLATQSDTLTRVYLSEHIQSTMARLFGKKPLQETTWMRNANVASSKLAEEGLLKSVSKGVVEITDTGRMYLAESKI
jgi:hypothetical protein